MEPMKHESNSLSSVGGGDQQSAVSPRCEAFTMTGDKIIRYDSKVSPNFVVVSVFFGSSELVGDMVLRLLVDRISEHLLGARSAHELSFCR
jgi:hypothetical protein